MTNAKLIVYALSGSSSSSILSLGDLVAGPVMPYYIRAEALQVAAYAAQGQPVESESVTQISNGFQACPPAGIDASCDSYTGFRWDASGRITNFLVDGQSVAGRVAIGASRSGSGLTISDVSAVRYATEDYIGITFEVRNTGDQTLGTVNPAFLPVFVTSSGTQYNYDSSNSALPGPLQPGQSSPVVAVFDTHAITGQFSLRTNDQTENVLVSTTLYMP